jgi:hypothetical protein
MPAYSKQLKCPMPKREIRPRLALLRTPPLGALKQLKIPTGIWENAKRNWPIVGPERRNKCPGNGDRCQLIL